MTLLALGINHKTAPVSLRERVSFSPDKLDQALDSLLAQPMVQGGVVLSTCNRTELYLSVEEQDNLQEALILSLIHISTAQLKFGDARRQIQFVVGHQNFVRINAEKTGHRRNGFAAEIHKCSRD